MASSSKKVIVAALVGRAIKDSGTAQFADTCNNLLAYAQRFPQREMGVTLVFDLYKSVGEAMFQVPAFQEWAKDVAPIMLD